MRIVVAGQGKSGTTALFAKIGEVMPPSTVRLFEPERFVEEAQGEVLAKIITDSPVLNDRSFASFDRKVLIVRDSRDNLISRLLYRIYNSEAVCRDSLKVEQFVALLQAKESNPASVSVVAIAGLQCAQLGIPFERWSQLIATRMALAFHQRNPEYFVYHYESLVAGEYAPVEDYLGLRFVTGAARVDAEHQRVARTCGKGNWRDWFTQEDVAFFRPRMSGYLARYGYGDDWELSAAPRMDARHGSQYVLKLVQQRLAQA